MAPLQFNPRPIDSRCDQFPVRSGAGTVAPPASRRTFAHPARNPTETDGIGPALDVMRGGRRSRPRPHQSNDDGMCPDDRVGAGQKGGIRRWTKGR
jgi:hypothetical protein